MIAVNDLKVKSSFIYLPKWHEETANKLKNTVEEVLQITIDMVSYACRLFEDVSFCVEDVIIADADFLVGVYEQAIVASSNTINVPDTVGYTIPHSSHEHGL